MLIKISDEKHRKNFFQDINYAFFSMFFITIANVIYKGELNLLGVSWVLHLWMLWNVKRIPKTNIPSRILRSLCYYIFPLLYILYYVFWENEGERKANDLLFFCVVAIMISLIYFYINRKKFKILLSDFYLSSGQKLDNLEFVSQISLLFFGAIIEELYFRYVIINLTESFLIVGITLSVMLFICQHKGTSWGELFTLKDVVIQVSESLISIFLLLISNSILPSLILHILFNSPHILSYFKRYKLQQNYKDSYELSDPFFDD